MLHWHLVLSCRILECMRHERYYTGHGKLPKIGNMPNKSMKYEHRFFAAGDPKSECQMGLPYLRSSLAYS